jgi:heme-degrading monooxygenase HmoA
MAVLLMLEIRGGTIEQYQRAREIMGISNDDDSLEGLISRVAARSEDGIVIADVWRSEEDVEKFFSEQAGAALAEAGMPEAQPSFARIRNHTEGAGSTPAALVIIEAADLTPDLYDQMAENVPGTHDGSHPALAHIAAVEPDGSVIVVDVWESPEAFQAFAQEQIAPAAEQAGFDRSSRGSTTCTTR